MPSTTMRSDGPQLVQSGLWQWKQGTGLERFELLRASHKDEWILRGTILTLSDSGPAEARYEVVCDGAWHTRRAEISLRDAKSEDGSNERVLRITAENGQWHENGQLNESVTGCIDIDLGWSPSTNTLPIRRLRLDVGQASGAVTAAWVSFPDLELRPLPQEYLRISEWQYRYSSSGGAFIAQISVDDEGLVLDYEGFWQRVSPTKYD
jgi:hypothetical protein